MIALLGTEYTTLAGTGGKKNEYYDVAGVPKS